MLITWSNIADAQVFNSPESVEFDYARNRWLISNNGSGEILSKNSSSGELTVFASNIPSGPHGLEIIEDTVYACDGGTLKAFNLNTGEQIFSQSLGASFLNGITKDTSKNLYITDFSAKKIFRFNAKNRSFSTLAANTVSTPNGIIFDLPNNRCVFVNWGSAAPVKAIDIATGTISTLATTTLGNCDGIAKDGAGNYYISSWSGGSKITRFNPNFTSSSTVVSTGLSSPADICYNLLTDTLAVPNSGSGNTVTFHYFGSTTATQPLEEPMNLRIFPNPASKWVQMTFSRLAQADHAELLDAQGRQVHGFNFEPMVLGSSPTLVDVSALSPGIYFVKLMIGNRLHTQSLQVE